MDEILFLFFEQLRMYYFYSSTCVGSVMNDVRWLRGYLIYNQNTGLVLVNQVRENNVPFSEGGGGV